MIRTHDNFRETLTQLGILPFEIGGLGTTWMKGIHESKFYYLMKKFEHYLDTLCLILILLLLLKSSKREYLREQFGVLLRIGRMKLIIWIGG